MNKLEKLAYRLIKKDYPLEQFYALLQSIFGLTEDPELLYQTLLARGFPLAQKDDHILLKTAKTPFLKQEFVVVDIETNGSKPEFSQIIEIGAIKFQGSEIIDRFESFVFAEEVPEYITKLTGIELDDLAHAPGQKEVLLAFKKFLGDSVFVAHNVNFDYNFISRKLEQLGYEKLANRKLCSIDLARKTIQSERYGLEYLNENLGINTLVSHRAYADAFTAYKLVQMALEKIPDEIITTEDLIKFSKSAKKTKKATKASESTSLPADLPSCSQQS
ncbi:3'-5' exonuclease [Nitratiruptor tergarcus]|uniref:DNA polymerase-3 subunit epsilon n=1 Tax=Nitratiruptor tergarcus DSM 16512 TaxID=1069081 RepID=A0A1W1WQ85_9BACT|nr:3'-5' exonuclease [Nitratiruptor tergarcus]SMC08382.1 DNA polymerase-3 subunit epsilon [Nitratiruptor tergarcus DSM 16512]